MSEIYLDKIKQKKDEIFRERQALEKEEQLWEKSFLEQKARLEQAIEFFKQNSRTSNRIF